MPDLSNSAIVFDLDDTLYKEIDYVKSGRTYIFNLFSEIKTIFSEKQFLNASLQHDLWEDTCVKMNWPISMKETLLWTYRTHKPNIQLDNKIKIMLSRLEKQHPSLIILTDGRSVTQRLKLQALDLIHWPVLISEEWGEKKPQSKRFEAVQKRWPSERYIYIGDNLNKDFFAPNQLNWLTIGVHDDGRNIHKQLSSEVPLNYLPKHWINCVSELESIIGS